MKSFNLESAIEHWRLDLQSHQGFEPADIEELEDHLRNKIDELVTQGLSPEKAYNKLIKDDFSDLQEVSNAYMLLKSRSSSFIHRTLIFNFLKIGLRSLKTRWSYSMVNLIGLVIGLSSVFGISIYVIHELSYDRFHSNSHHIYRTVNNYERSNGDFSYPLGPPALAAAIGTDLPEIKRVTRLRTSDEILLRYNGHEFLESGGFYADSSFLQMFSFPLASGNPLHALNEPNSIVLTDAMAKKYFGDTNPVGKVMSFGNNRSLKVTGLLVPVPQNSHIKFDFLISFSSYIVPEGYLADLNSWSWLGFLTYFETYESTDVSSLENSISSIYKRFNTSKRNLDIKITLQPLHDIYLKSGHLSNPRGDLFETNSMTTILSLAAIALLILLVASFNYLNITIANLQNRLKEMGIRKVMGSPVSKILMQLVTESSMIVFISGIVALFVAVFGLTLGFGNVQLLHILTLSNIFISIIPLTALSLILGLIVGLFASSALAKSNTLDLLKGHHIRRSSGISLKYGMLFVQYFISAALIMLSLIVTDQVQHFNQKQLGYERNGIIVLSGLPNKLTEGYDVFKQEMLQHPDVSNITLSSHAFEGGASSGPLRAIDWPDGQTINTSYYQVGYDFLKVTGIKLTDGRFFSRNNSSDSISSLVINETCARMLDIYQPEGQKVQFAGGREFKIIGIVSDFHYKSLHHEIGPMAILMPFTNSSHIIVKYNSTQLPGLITSIENTWTQVTGDSFDALSLNFLDDILQQQYQDEQYFGKLINLFTLLAIFIACLGLWSLTSITINQKIKQIGIHKVLGASSLDILIGISKAFILVSLAGTLFSWPVIDKVSSYWLENFASHIEPGVIQALKTMALVVLISMITLATQYFKVTRKNPADILQNE